MPEEDVKKAIEEKKEPGSWWTRLDTKVKIGFFIFLAILLYAWIIKGVDTKTIFLLGGLIVAALIALSAGVERGADIISPEQAIDITIDYVKRMKDKGILDVKTKVFFNGYCSDLVHRDGVPESYYAGFDFYNPDHSVDHTRAIIGGKSPYIGFVSFQKLDKPFNGIDDIEPHRVSTVPWRLAEAKRKELEWIYKG